MTDKEIYQLLLGIMDMMRTQEEGRVAMARLVNSHLSLLESVLIKTLEMAARQDWQDREEDLLALKLRFEQSSHRTDFRALLAQIESQHELAEHLQSNLRKALESL